LFVELAGGGRLGMGDWIGVAPTASLAVGALLGRWELGLAGSADFTYAPITRSRPSGFALSTYGADAFVGYRPALGPVSGIIGVAGGASYVNESVWTPDGNFAGPQDGGTVRYQGAQIEIGGYLGVVVPMTRILHFRSQLGARAVAARFGTASTDPSLPTLPRWDASLSLGVEGVWP
jgi:hypothetical protein